MSVNNSGESSGGAIAGSDRSTPESDNLPADSAEKQCLFALKRLHLDPAPAGIFFDKNQIERGTVLGGDKETEVSSNVFGLRTVAKSVYQYHLEFSKVFKDDKTRPLVEDNDGRKLPDYTTYQNRHMHRKLLSAFLQKFPNVFGQDPDNFCYDYSTTLFSLIEIQAIDTMLELEANETLQAIERPYKVTLVIKKPAENVFDIRDINKKNETNDVASQPLHVVRFLELATSRYASQHPEDHVMYESKKTFYMDAEKYGFNSLNLGNGKYLAPGASKTVVSVEGHKNLGAPAVVIDSKKTPFYNSMNLLEMLCIGLQRTPDGVVDRFQIEIIDKYLKRLEGFPIYGSRQEIPIALSKLCKNDALSTTIEYNGNRITVAEYYQQRYDIIVRYPHWPLVQAAKKVKGSFPTFPPELLHVADFQRVGNGNITSTDIAKIVRACAVNPSIKRNEVENCFHSFSFGVDEFMKKAGLSVLDAPLTIPARILKTPRIQYANAGGVNPEENGKWRLPRQAKYVRGITCHSWCGIFLNVRGERMREGDFQQFVRKYVDECRARGLNMADPQGVYPVDCTELAIEEAFKLAAQDGNQFMLFCHSDRDNSMHNAIKAMERRYGVITQCIRTKTIDNVMKKSPLTLENIVAKTNIKLGGLNNQVFLDNYDIDSTVLFIGLGMNHPAGGLGIPVAASQEGDNADKANSGGSGSGSGSSTPPNYSILGFAANDGRNANEFIGNFFFQPMLRDEKLTVLDKLLVEILERFKANRGFPPSRVILFRSGCAEGAFGSVLRYEIPVIAAMIEKYAPGAPVSVVVPSKMHSLRFFKQDIDPRTRSDDQNIRPGTVLDRVVVSSVYSEYYLNSHLAIQGTAKTTKYTIIYSTEKDATLDMFERWTNALCYDFQIVTSPTSLPAPVYIANRYAERGRQIFNNYSSSGKHHHGNGSSGNGSNGHDSNGGDDPENAPNPFYLRSLEFNYTHMDFLRDKRINA